MPSIFYGTRLAWIFGEPYTKSRRYYDDDDLPLEVASSAPATRTLKQPRQTGNTLLKIIWLLAGIVSIVMPVLVCNARMNEDQNSQWNVVAKQYNKYQAQQQQQNQQEAKKFYDVNNCKWYNFGCQPYYVDEGGNPVTEEEMQEEKYRQQQEKQQQYYEQQAEKQQQNYENQQQYYEQQAQYQDQYLQYGANGRPTWYWGQSEEAREKAMEAGEPSPSLKFVYAWQMIMFLSILAYGYHVLHYLKSLAFLTGALVIWFQFNFLAMFLLSDGSILTEDHILELTGFYGQFAVLMFMTSAWYAVFGLLFALGFFIKSYFSPSQEGPTTATTTTNALEEDKTTDYQAMDAPPSPTKSDVGEDYVKVV